MSLRSWRIVIAVRYSSRLKIESRASLSRRSVAAHTAIRFQKQQIAVKTTRDFLTTQNQPDKVIFYGTRKFTRRTANCYSGGHSAQAESATQLPCRTIR